MKGHPLELWLDDGKKIESVKSAAKLFGLSPGRISHYIQEAREEGRPYAIVKQHRLYLVDPATIKRKPKSITMLRKRPENVLLYGLITRASGQIWR